MLRFDISLWLGTYLAAQLASQALSDVVMGTLADRWGHKQVLKLANLIGVLALVASVLAPSPEWLIGAYVLIGIATSGYQLSGYTLVFAFSTPAERPTYIGVANSVLTPVGAIGPIVAGIVADLAGYGWMFGLLLAVGLYGLFVLHKQVPAPARVAQA